MAIDKDRLQLDIPDLVAEDCIETAFQLLDRDKDEKITVEDLQFCTQFHKLAFNDDVLGGMFTEAHGRGKGLEPGKLHLTDVTNSVSFRKVLICDGEVDSLDKFSKAHSRKTFYLSRPYRDQWIMMIQALLGTPQIFCQPEIVKPKKVPIFSYYEQSQHKPQLKQTKKQALAGKVTVSNDAPSKQWLDKIASERSSSIQEVSINSTIAGNLDDGTLSSPRTPTFGFAAQLQFTTFEKKLMVDNSAN